MCSLLTFAATRLPAFLKVLATEEWLFADGREYRFEVAERAFGQVFHGSHSKNLILQVQF